MVLPYALPGYSVSLTAHLARATDDVGDAIAYALATFTAQETSQTAKEAIFARAASANARGAMAVVRAFLLRLLLLAGRRAPGYVHLKGCLRLGLHWRSLHGRGLSNYGLHGGG